MARMAVHVAVHCETPVCLFSPPGGKSDTIARKKGSSDRPKLGEHRFPRGKKKEMAAHTFKPGTERKFISSSVWLFSGGHGRLFSQVGEITVA